MSESRFPIAAPHRTGAPRGSVPLQRRARALLGLFLTLGLALGVTTVLAAPAQAAGWDWAARFAREVVRPGAVDRDPWNIAHVYELQHRLKRAGYLRGVRPNGVFGPQTEAAVVAFQKKVGVRANGVVRHDTWQRLIASTVRGRGVVPAGCFGKGWHACYDRRRHQTNLYHKGTLVNSWLVRGGGRSTKTRTGTYTVFRRSIDHVSNLYGSPMPYAQFFSGGQAFHGSRAMMDPYVGHSHGCVNMYVEDARQLWRLTADKNLHVHVYGRWD